MRSKTVAAFVLVALTSATVFAGAIYKIKCNDKNCRFDSQFNFGGGMMFHEAAGYCTTCEAFVSVTWGREMPNKKGEPAPFIGEVWDSQSGRRIRLFTCKHCKRPVAEIEKPADIKMCPKCMKARVTTQPWGQYD